MEVMFFNGWFALLRIAVVGILAYAALVVFLRFSGKRTLAKMNAFDLNVTVSLGSTLATIALSADVALAEGLLALALLVALQFVITRIAGSTLGGLLRRRSTLPQAHGVTIGADAVLVSNETAAAMESRQAP